MFFSEIPLFHVLNARITFGNIFGADSPAPGISCINDADSGSPLCCVVEEGCFDPPPTYSVMGKQSIIIYHTDAGILSFISFRSVFLFFIWKICILFLPNVYKLLALLQYHPFHWTKLPTHSSIQNSQHLPSDKLLASSSRENSLLLSPDKTPCSFLQIKIPAPFSW